MSGNILNQIVEQKKKEVDQLDCTALQPKKSTRNFKKSLLGKHNIIAEIKFKSPSQNSIRSDVSVEEVAKVYNEYASAISVLTDKEFFGGSLQNITKAKNHSSCPILRKDFIIDEKQITQAAHAGADAILLIAAILTKEQINQFIKTANQFNMDCLVEVHNEEELQKVLQTTADIIGINNRDLKSFQIDINTTNKLKKLIPQKNSQGKDIIVVSESGFNTREQIKSVNTNAVLIGTNLIKEQNIKQKLQSLRVPKVKICGITNTKDAKAAIESGADYIGLNFYKKSPRYVTNEQAKQIRSITPSSIALIGVFVNEEKETISKIAQEVNLDMLQLHGTESEEFCNSFSLPVIKAIHIKDNPPLEQIKQYKNNFAILFDTKCDLLGGSGKTFNIQLIADINSKTTGTEIKNPRCKQRGIFSPLKGSNESQQAAGYGTHQGIKNNNPTKMFLAGGVNSQTISDMLNIVDPFCVDICSGVEKEKGIKDHEKMREIISKIKDTKIK